MPVLAFPGPAAPAPPHVTIEAPQGWQATPPGPALLRVQGPGAGAEPITVTVRTETRAAGLAAADLADQVAASGDHDDTELDPPFVVDLGEREWLGRNVSWESPTGTVVEVHLVTAATTTEAVSQFVVATGSVRGPALDADYDTVQTVLETLVVREVVA